MYGMRGTILPGRYDDRRDGQRLSSEQPGTGVERSAVQRMLRTGLRQIDEDTLFPGIHFQSVPGTV